MALVLAVDLADETSPTNVFAPTLSLRGMLVPSKVCNTSAMPVPPVQRKSLVSQCELGKASNLTRLPATGLLAEPLSAEPWCEPMND